MSRKTAECEQPEKYKSEMFHGYDSDGTMMRIGCMNMMLHDVDQPQMQKCNSLSDDNKDADCYSLCLANPPLQAVWMPTTSPSRSVRR